MNTSIRITLTMFLSWITLSTQALEVGDQAPAFSLQATDGKTYSLEQFHDKQAVVIAWYPKAFTSGCTIECKSLAQNGHLLKGLDVTYFMASVDDLDVNQKFAEENEADFPLLSDPSKEVAEAYEVLAFYGVPNRHTFYIGKDGKILFIDRRINAATSAEDMAAKLIELGIPARQVSESAA
ncbi:peroxiredoxin [SAR92 clade bacterium H921]|nr:peroxiredoxin [SAR92 clade bacterium H921]